MMKQCGSKQVLKKYKTSSILWGTVPGFSCLVWVFPVLCGVYDGKNRYIPALYIQLIPNIVPFVKP
jgi:hypothetical protein